MAPPDILRHGTRAAACFQTSGLLVVKTDGPFFVRGCKVEGGRPSSSRRYSQAPCIGWRVLVWGLKFRIDRHLHGVGEVIGGGGEGDDL